MSCRRLWTGKFMKVSRELLAFASCVHWCVQDSRRLLGKLDEGSALSLAPCRAVSSSSHPPCAVLHRVLAPAVCGTRSDETLCHARCIKVGSGARGEMSSRRAW